MSTTPRIQVVLFRLAEVDCVHLAVLQLFGALVDTAPVIPFLV